MLLQEVVEPKKKKLITEVVEVQKDNPTPKKPLTESK